MTAPKNLASFVSLVLCPMLAISVLAASSLTPSPVDLSNSVSEAVQSPAAFLTSMESLDDTHRLAIGDRLSFRIVEDEEDPRPLFVTDSGEVEVPYIGRFPAVGKTCKQLAHDLKLSLEVDYYYNATVILAVDVMARSRGRVYLVGAVRAAGPQEIPSDENFTLSKAILRAGGFGDFADKRNVRVTRKGAHGNEHTFSVNVAEILERGRTGNDVTLEPGDFIYIPERMIRF
jgi:protein involved in polysaccharide export with SLBB domain